MLMMFESRRERDHYGCRFLLLPLELRPEAVELAHASTAEECVPLGRGEPEHRARRVLAVPDTDDPARKVGNLDAGTV
jgi:hypothetical protein